jgi:hypothetical protein
MDNGDINASRLFGGNAAEVIFLLDSESAKSFAYLFNLGKYHAKDS